MLQPRYADVWGDTVELRHLFWAMVIGVCLGLVGYLPGLRVFTVLPGVKPELAKAYALLTGVVGCLMGAVVSARLFRPKRVVEEDPARWRTERERVVAELQIIPEEEKRQLERAESGIRAEVRELGLDVVLLGEPQRLHER